MLTLRGTPLSVSAAPSVAKPFLFFVLFVSFGHPLPADAGEPPPPQPPKLAPASGEGEQAMKGFRLPPGFKIEQFAAEPMLAHPVAFCQDEQGRFYVAETFRFADGINGGGDKDFGALDLRGHMDWLNEDLACRTVEDRLAMYRRHLGDKVQRYTLNSEQVRLIEDTDGDGKADRATVFANCFNRILDGAAAGVLARKGNVWLTCIPDLWSLRDTDGDGKADEKKVLHHGFGVRIAFLGHDLHGLIMGPDGKLYFSIGDRGFNLATPEGRALDHPECGGVFRCNPDGSDLELFASGLRNPQELAFDQYGNLFTGDNNADKGDPARWVYLVEGGDSGWRGGYQYITTPRVLGPWMAEKLCYTHTEDQPAYIVPPVATLGVGPSGIAYCPGTGMPESLKDHFLYCDYRGGGGGVLSFAVKPKGAGFEVVDLKEFFWQNQSTDVLFGNDGAIYASVWVGGIEKSGKGRIYRLFDPEAIKDPIVAETKKLIAEGMEKRPNEELAKLLEHRDMRVRQEAQFELAARGEKAVSTLAESLKGKHQLARLHAVWGLGQIAARFQSPNGDQEAAVAAALAPILPLLSDPDDEVCAQAAKVLGEQRCFKAAKDVAALLKRSSLRVRFFAAMSLGKIGDAGEIDPLIEMLRENADKDPFLRHAGFMGLAGIAQLRNLFAAIMEKADDPSPAVRLAILLVMRRHSRYEIGRFLHDPKPSLILEAARAINDVPIHHAMVQLAALVAEIPKKEIPRHDFTLEYWENTGGTSVKELAKHPDFPARPTSVSQLGSFEAPRDRGDNFGGRISGFVTAPQSGAYTFWIASDDNGELWLSADDKPENKKLIATMPEWCPARDWDKRPEQKSAPVNLVAGRRYYIEALYKEGGGFDNLAVGWQLPDGKLERPIGDAGADDDSAPLLRRALNANLRAGNEENAQMLAAFAARNDMNAALRAEALDMLAEWVQPFDRDRIVNLHRPIPPSDAVFASDAARPHVPGLLSSAPGIVRAAAARLAGKYQLREAGPALLALLNDEAQHSDARVEALKALAALKDAKLGEAVRKAMNDKQIKLRQEAGAQLAKLNPAEALPMLEAALANAPLPEKQNAFRILAAMQKPEADAVLAAWLDKLLAGKLAPEVQLDLLEAANLSAGAAVKERLVKVQDSLSKTDELAPFRAALAGGDIEAGRKLFYEHASAQCVRCHKAGAHGGDVGPDLKGIAARQKPEYLLESMIAPSAQIAQGFETAVVSLNDGRVFTGIIKSEDDKQLSIVGADGKPAAVPKADIKKRAGQKISTMPPVGEVLSKSEIRNLVEFLSSLK